MVVIDFAHTPDALAKVLCGAMRRHSRAESICVFGCGGDRDRGKRPLMARAVEAGADRAWVTSDNPRSEAPADDRGGNRRRVFSGRVAVDVELDRAAAIRSAPSLCTRRRCRAGGRKRPRDLSGDRRTSSCRFAISEVVQQVFVAQSEVTRLKRRRRHTVDIRPRHHRLLVRAFSDVDRSVDGGRYTRTRRRLRRRRARNFRTSR